VFFLDKNTFFLGISQFMLFAQKASHFPKSFYSKKTFPSSAIFSITDAESL